MLYGFNRSIMVLNMVFINVGIFINLNILLRMNRCIYLFIIINFRLLN